MVKTGLLYELSENLNSVWESRNNIKKHEKEQEKLIATLSEIGQADDIALILKAEKSVLLNEMDIYTRQSKSTVPHHKVAQAIASELKHRRDLALKSYQKALVAVAEAQRSYSNLLNAPDKYIDSTFDTISHHKRSKNNIPESDLFLDFHKDHQGRLTSWLSGSQLTEVQRDFFSQRKTNLQIAFAGYKQLQLQAFTPTPGDPADEYDFSPDV